MTALVLIKIMTHTLLLSILILLTGCVTPMAYHEPKVFKFYDHYEINEIISIALVKKDQIKHLHSGLKTFNKYAVISDDLRNSQTYMAVCMSGKHKGTGAKNFTIYGVLPEKKIISNDYYTLNLISSFPGCYEYSIMEYKKIPMSIGLDQVYMSKNYRQDIRFYSMIYDKKIDYIINEYVGPNYSTKINYFYYPMIVGAIVVDVLTAPLQIVIIGVLAILFQNIGPISP